MILLLQSSAAALVKSRTKENNVLRQRVTGLGQPIFQNVSMKKRSKLEVEIRNILSDVLLVSLRDREMSTPLNMIFQFCQFIKEKGRDRIRVTELLNYENGVENRGSDTVLEVK